MRGKLVLGLVLMLSVCTAAVAQKKTSGSRELTSGTDLAAVCGSDRNDDRLVCDAFIKGVFYTFRLMQDTLGTIPKTYVCVPRDVTTEQLRSVFLKYAKNHPDKLGYGSPGAFFGALLEAFPCSAN